MNGVQTLTTTVAEARTLYEEYRTALKTHKDQYLHDLKTVYGHMKHGRAVLDVWQAFRDTGLDANGDPKIAIAQSSAARVFMRKRQDGGAVFTVREIPWRRGEGLRNGRGPNGTFKEDVVLPAGSFTWPLEPPAPGRTWQVVRRENLATTVPVVPAKFLPASGLSNYYTLWEVEKWDVLTPPRDPLLLRRVSPNTFVVLAAWELSEIERTVLRGRIA